MKKVYYIFNIIFIILFLQIVFQFVLNTPRGGDDEIFNIVFCSTFLVTFNLLGLLFLNRFQKHEKIVYITLNMIQVIAFIFFVFYRIANIRFDDPQGTDMSDTYYLYYLFVFYRIEGFTYYKISQFLLYIYRSLDTLIWAYSPPFLFTIYIAVSKLINKLLNKHEILDKKNQLISQCH